MRTPKFLFIVFLMLPVKKQCSPSDTSALIWNVLPSLIKQNGETIKNVIKTMDFSKIIAFFNPAKNPNISKFVDSYKNSLNEDLFLNATQLLNKYGYSTEEHEIQTNDQYILTMIRIPRNGSAVLVMPGGPCSADDFITLGSQAALAYVLADAGFDVWLGNARGTKYSLKHVSFSIDSPAYWDFTIDEIARYDQAAMIDHILSKSKNKKLNIIGHSQGTTSSFILCSERPEYNDKISVLIMLTPIVSFRHSRSLIIHMLSWILSPTNVQYLESIGINSIFTPPELIKALGSFFCGTPDLALGICYNFYRTYLGSSDYKQINTSSLSIAYSHFPTGMSLKTVAHNLQLARTAFTKYDYGSLRNKNKYGTLVPPEYSLEKVTTKVFLVYSDNDLLNAMKDLEPLKKLPNIIEFYRVPYDEFDHVDYIFAKDVKTLLYDKLVEVLRSNI